MEDERSKKLIKKEFGVKYLSYHVRRIPRSFGRDRLIPISEGLR